LILPRFPPTELGIYALYTPNRYLAAKTRVLIDFLVGRSLPAELTARGEGTRAAGDAPLERGYSAALAAARSVTAARS
jgi:hypothetical protein